MRKRFLRVPLGVSLHDIITDAIRSTVELCGGNKSEAARRLGISLCTVRHRLGGYVYRQDRRAA